MRNITILQEPIEKASALALTLAKDHSCQKQVVQLWIDTEATVKSDDRRLALFYLCNDIVQKSQAGIDNGKL